MFSVQNVSQTTGTGTLKICKLPECAKDQSQLFRRISGLKGLYVFYGTRNKTWMFLKEVS